MELQKFHPWQQQIIHFFQCETSARSQEEGIRSGGCEKTIFSSKAPNCTSTHFELRRIGADKNFGASFVVKAHGFFAGPASDRIFVLDRFVVLSGAAAMKSWRSIL